MKTVWFVDDDEDMSRAVNLMLGLLNYQMRPFKNARMAAKTLLNGERPDVLLLDINMPEVSGVDLLEFVRRRAEWANLPIVMLSSEAADVQVDQALDLGADGFIAKPVTIEELESALNQAIQKRQFQGNITE